MTHSKSEWSRGGWFVSVNWVLVVLFLGQPSLSTRGEESVPRDSAGTRSPSPSVDDPTTPLGASSGGQRGDLGAAEAQAPVAETEIRYNGTPSPGARITVGVPGPEDPTTSYRWTQIEGPAVKIDDVTKPQIEMTIPPDAQKLVFLLTLKDGRGERSARVSIPIKPRAEQNATDSPRADAGDDQIGLVGRRITLNGSSSPSQGKIFYRWIQIGGPEVVEVVPDKKIYSFIPSKPGIYRFALLVARNNAISKPDEVVVVVGEHPGASGVKTKDVIGGAISSSALGPATPGAVNNSGRLTTDIVAEVFEAISDRVDLYSTFADLTSELTRRLDTVIIKDPYARQYWSQLVFMPLTQRTVAELLPDGLNLALPQSHHQTLTPSQKTKLQILFRTYSQEIRTRTQAR
jgi:hypothetical protein